MGGFIWPQKLWDKPCRALQVIRYLLIILLHSELGVFHQHTLTGRVSAGPAAVPAVVQKHDGQSRQQQQPAANATRNR